MELYEKKRVYVENWIESYRVARDIMKLQPEIGLLFCPSKQVVAVRFEDGNPMINVDNYLIERETSENLRQIIYMHEIGEIQLANSFLGRLFGLTRNLGMAPSVLTSLRENEVNSRVYETLKSCTGQRRASERMSRFVDEWLSIRPPWYKKIGSSGEYVDRNMRFLR